MKIAIIMPELSMGGAERVAVSLSNWLVNNKEDEIYFINMASNTNNFEFDDKLKVYHKTYDTTNIKGIKPVVIIKKILKKRKYINETINKISPDIIFEMLYYPLLFVLPYKIKHKNVVIIGSERANPNLKGIPLHTKILAKICPILCDGYIFQTERVKQMFSKSVKKKSMVIPNAVSNPYIKEITKTKREKVISNMGRLEYQKGQDILIKAFNIVHKKYSDYKLIIYGEGSKEREYQQLISKLKLQDSVILAGKVQKAILEVNKSEIFVFPSRYEGMPNALLEAMACGLPCISTDCVAGPSEIIENNVNGILTEVDNIKQIAEKMIYLIENKDVADKMGKEAQKVLYNYSTDNIFNEYYRFFCEIAKRKKK